MLDKDSSIFSFSHIATGGTIDSYWLPSRENVVPNDTSKIPDYLGKVGFRLTNVLPTQDRQFDSKSPLGKLKDSREISIDDQLLIIDAIKNCSLKKILLTVGTFLMPDVASMLEEYTQEKQIVLVGSFYPIDHTEADAGFNLGMAIATLQGDTSSRVSVVMNGHIFDAGRGIIKDITTSRFHQIKKPAIESPSHNFSLVNTTGTINKSLGSKMKFSDLGESPIPAYLRDRVLMSQCDLPNVIKSDEMGIFKPTQFKLISEHINSNDGPVIVTTELTRIEKARDYLVRNIDAQKTVVLTGSRMPLRDVAMSDAPFQLGYAFAAARSLKPGVYVAVDGKIS